MNVLRWNQNWGWVFCAGIYIELPMFRRNVDSFPFRRTSGTPAWPFFSKGHVKKIRRNHIIIYDVLAVPIVNLRFSIAPLVLIIIILIMILKMLVKIKKIPSRHKLGFIVELHDLVETILRVWT